MRTRVFGFGGTLTFITLAFLFLASFAPAAHARQARTVLFASGLEAPVSVAHAPGDASRLFVLGRFGRITIHDTATGQARPQPFINLVSLVCCFGNSNMVGLTFDPDYATNGYFYVHYQGIPTESVVARYRVTSNPDIADPASATIILRTARTAFGHNGGAIAFSPIDRLLYVPTGDSGNGMVADPLNASQDLNSYLGKVLRIDPSVDDFPADPNRHYRIPPTNPFVGQAGRLGEIWAYGMRNPYQSTFDRANGDYWIADVGQELREEIDFEPANAAGGRNYGWRCREGDICSGFGGCVCADASLTPPIFVYDHAAGCSISGGSVYRGSAIPSFQGQFFFSDYCSGLIWAVRRNTNQTVDFFNYTALLAPPPGMEFRGVASIGDDAAGELYIADINAGRVFKIVPPPATCIADVDDGTGTGTPDGGVTIDDLLYYLGLFENGDVDADVDDGTGTGTPDGGVTIDDLLYFLFRFEMGC